jgi:hypothetical protein
LCFPIIILYTKGLGTAACHVAFHTASQDGSWMTQNHWRNGENLIQKETDMAEHLKVAPHTVNAMVLKKKK